MEICTENRVSRSVPGMRESKRMREGQAEERDERKGETVGVGHAHKHTHTKTQERERSSVCPSLSLPFPQNTTIHSLTILSHSINFLDIRQSPLLRVRGTRA